MSKYADLPMDMANATLVAAAEVTGAYRLWTFDQHFRAYVLHENKQMELVPSL